MGGTLRWLLMAVALTALAAAVARPDEPGGKAPAAPAGKAPDKPPAKAPGAKERAVPAGSRPLRVGLLDVARLALANNPEIARKGLDPTVATGELRRARAEFDPLLFGSARHTHDESRSGAAGGGTDPLSSLFSLFGSGTSGDPGETRTDTSVFEAGIRQKLRTGGTLELVYNTQRVKTKTTGDSGGGLGGLGFFSVMDPQWTSRVELRLDHPLLQGFGLEFNTANIRIAEIQRKIAQLEADDTVRRVIAQVLVTYWDLALAIREKEIHVSSLQRAQQLLELNRERLQRGLVSRLDVLRAEVGVAQRQEAILKVENQIRDVEDQLKRLVLPQEEVFSKAIVLLPTEGLAYKTEALHLSDLVKTALALRSDYQRAGRQFESQTIAYRRARNLLLPKLNFRGRAGYSGQGESFSDSNKELGEFELFSWEAGLALEVPLGNQAAKGDVQKARAQLEQAKIALDEVERQVVLEVRTAAREVATTLQRIETTRESRRLTQLQLDGELERFKLGQSTNKVVLDYEEDLAQEQLRELQAVIAYKKSLVGLSRSQGTVIETYLGGGRIPPARVR